MYLNYCISVLLLAHVLTDFYFQSDNMTDSKQTDKHVLAIHSAIFFITSLILLIPVISMKILVLISLLSISHFALDFAKIKLCNKANNFSIPLFTLDQVCHVLAVIGLTPFFSSAGLNITSINFWTFIVKYYPFLKYITLIKLINYIVLLIFYLFIVNGGSIIVKLFLNTYNSLKNEPEEININAGSLIGKLERIIILTLVINGYYNAIGYVIAAKSIARYKKLEDDKQFGEYYLVGTLLSVLIALVFGLIYNFIYKFM
ncbi:MAG: hypothetical protein HPY66_3080 [Firmicutes bacterium]|nr:hypothetical protein [Bacillota bacterium]